MTEQTKTQEAQSANIWPKVKIRGAYPGDPEDGRIVEQADWPSIGIGERTAEALRTGDFAGTSIPDGSGGHHRMASRYTQKDAERDAAPQLAEALTGLKALVERDYSGYDCIEEWHAAVAALKAAGWL